MIKVDVNTIEVEKAVPAVIEKVQFERGYLERQRASIISQRDEYVSARNKELEEVDSYLAECDKLGIVAKPEPESLLEIAK
jgi:hypothetical protein